MSRNRDRQAELEPERINAARQQFDRLKLKYDYNTAMRCFVIQYHTGLIFFYPYTGWFSGKRIGDGRGILKLIKRIYQFKD